MADPFRPKKPYPKNEDFGESLDPVGGDARVAGPFDQFTAFLRTTTPVGQPAMALFAHLRNAWSTVRDLVAQQQWDQLHGVVEALLEDVAECGEGANRVEDLKLLDDLRKRLEALQAAVDDVL